MATGIINPLLNTVSATISNPQTLNQLVFVDQLWRLTRTIGLALLTLIVLWQVFKYFFQFAGIETEEPLAIAAKTVIFGFLIIYSKDILMYGVGFANEFTTTITSLGSPNLGIIESYINNINSEGGGIFVLKFILVIMLLFKVIGLLFKMCQRFILCALLIVASPLAFACGATSATKGFLAGFIKLFTGNLAIQFLQVLCLQALSFMLQSAAPGEHEILYFIMMFGLVKITIMLEDIVRDVSMSVGIGRDMGNALHTVQSTVHLSTTAINMLKR